MVHYEGFIGFSFTPAFRSQPPFDFLVMPPRSGAANGRLGGRLSGGSRARKSLANVQRVRFVHPASAPALGLAIAGKVEAPKKSEKRRKSAGDAPSADVLREIALRLRAPSRAF